MQDAFIHHEKANIDQMYLKRVYLKIKSKVKKKYSQFYWAYWLNNNNSESNESCM